MSNWIQLKEKKEQRKNNIGKAGAILKRAHDESRDLTPEEEKEFEALHKMADELLKQIELISKQSEAEGSVEDEPEQEASRHAVPHVETRQKPKTEAAELRKKAFNKYLRGLALTGSEQRALTIGGSATGAEMVPDDFWAGYYEVLRTTGSIRRANPRVETTSNGRSVPYPVYDDTANEGEIITAGGTATTTADPATDSLILGAHLFSSKVFSLAKDYIQDVAHDAEAAVRKMALARITAHLDRKLTVGTGTNEPQGAVTGASVGVTAAATNAVTYNEILDLIHSLSEPYREGAVLQMSDSTLLAVKKLVDADGNSIWFHGAAGNAGNGIPATIAGVPYIVNPWMADLGVSAKPILYGNFQLGYIVRDTVGAELHVDPYTNGRKYLIDYCMFSRHDGGVVDSSAMKVLQCAAA